MKQIGIRFLSLILCSSILLGILPVVSVQASEVMSNLAEVPVLENTFATEETTVPTEALPEEDISSPDEIPPEDATLSAAEEQPRETTAPIQETTAEESFNSNAEFLSSMESTSTMDCPTEEEAYQAMISLQETYPEGMSWTNENAYVWQADTSFTGYGCAAFAFLLSDAAFGSLPARQINCGEFIYEDIRVGDILRINNTHSVVVLETYPNHVILAEGNYNNSIHWGRMLTKEKVVSSTDYILTRYPEHQHTSELCNQKDPTETEPGYTGDQICTDCGAILEAGEEIPATGNFLTSGECGDDLIWTLDHDGLLTISGSGEMYSYSSDDSNCAPWKLYRDSITKVMVDDGVTSIGSYAFCACTAIAEIILPDTLEQIGPWSFAMCQNLYKLILPNQTTSIGVNAFYSCSYLSEVTLPNSLATIESYAFSSCESLKQIHLPDSLTSLGSGAFSGCKSLTQVTIPSNITKIPEGAFSRCSDLASVSFHNRLKEIGIRAFYKCYYLKRLDIPASVEIIGQEAFNDSIYLDAVAFYGDAPSITYDGTLSPEQGSLIFGGMDAYNDVIFYPAGNETWTDTVKNSFIDLKAYNKPQWVPFDPNIGTSGICGSSLTWNVDTAAGILTISGAGDMDSWDPEKLSAPWSYLGESIREIHIGAGVTSIGDNAFTYVDIEKIHFAGPAPQFGTDIFPSDRTIVIYYPADVLGWEDMISQPVNWRVQWIQEGGIAEYLQTLSENCDSMTPDEIRQAVQALDQEELLKAMRISDLSGPLWKLDYATGVSSELVIVPGVPEFDQVYSTAMWGSYGLNLNNLVSSDIGTKVILSKPSKPISIPEGYASDRAIHFSISFENIQNPEKLAVPINIDMDLEESMNPMFQTVFWRNNETGKIEEIPSTCQWSKTGIGIAFVIAGAGDYVFVPKSNSAVTGKCGDNLTWTYEENRTLTISGSGEMYDYGMTSNLAPWSYYREDVEQIVIGEQVETIGNYAFYDCRFVTNITIPASVRAIGRGAFSSSDDDVFFFEGNAPKVDKDAFSGYRIDIYYPADNTTWTESAKAAFEGEHTDINWWPTGTSGSCGDQVTWNFDKTTGTLTISGTGPIDTEIQGTYESEFRSPWIPYRKKITSIVIEEGITYICESAFSGCTNAVSVSLANTVTVIDLFAFCECSSLTSVDFPYGLTTLGDCAFSGCSKLSHITLPESLTILGAGVFSECSSLVNVQIPQSVTSIYWSAFSYCTNLTSVVLPDSISIIDGQTFLGCTNLREITIPNSVTSIGSHAFDRCKQLSSVTIPGSVTNVGREAFAECPSLSSIHFEGDAPSFADAIDCFKGVTAVAYYPSNNDTWTENVLQNYGGNITWVSAAGCVHQNTTVENAKDATCTADGYTGDILCSVCGEMIRSGETVPAPGHNWDKGTVTTQPQVDAAGETTYTCVACGESKTEDIPATGTVSWYANDGFFFTTFNDLKEMSKREYSTEVFAQYKGNTPLVIEEDLTIPENLVLGNGSLLFPNTETIVPAKVTLRAYQISVRDFIVEGTAYISDYLSAEVKLDVSGALYNSGQIYVDMEHGQLIGEENIFHTSDSAFLSANYLVTSSEELITVVKEASMSSNPHRRYKLTDNWYSSGNPETVDFSTITQSFTLPENCDFYYDGYYNDTLTIAKDCVVTIEGNFYLGTALYVEGQLINNGQICRSTKNSDKPGIVLTNGGAYHGTGSLIIYDDFSASVPLNEKLPGFNLDAFTITKGMDEDYKYYDYGPYWDLTPFPSCTTHTWDDGIITMDPTATESGIKTYTCTVCGETKTEEIPATGEVVPDAGDANGDGKINSRDVLAILQFRAGKDASINETAADVNQDGKINSRDILAILQLRAGK